LPKAVVFAFDYGAHCDIRSAASNKRAAVKPGSKTIQLLESKKHINSSYRRLRSQRIQDRALSLSSK